MSKNNNNIENEFFLSHWIDGRLTDTELKKLVSDDDFIAYKKLKKGLDVYAELEQPANDSFTAIQNKIGKSTKVRRLNYKWIASIAAVLIFFVGFYSLLGNDAVFNESSFGEHKTVALLDGSEVILNAKSALKYSKKDWKNNREIYLDGEAFFKVEKGSKFTVKTKNGNITVLGTQFSVNSTNDYFEVKCFEGKVQVLNNNKKYVLIPTESFRKINNTINTSLSFINKQPLWLLGESAYRSVPLRQVISDFEKQFQVRIDASRINENVIFTGSFNHNDVNMALKSVFEALELKSEFNSKNTIVLDK